MEVESAILLAAFYSMIVLLLVAGVMYAENIVAAMVGEDFVGKRDQENGD